MSNGRSIIHLDMDAYFASVEQLSNPFLKGKPVAVTGRGNRTVITTASYEARAYGVKTGMTLSDARRLCPRLIRVDANNDKYFYTTFKIREILLRFTDRVETYSIDEFFLDITGCLSPSEIVRKIKDAVINETGLSCSCGLAPNKLLAKLGSKIHKPDGLTIINAEDFAKTSVEMPVDKLHGLGKKTAEHLNRLGINTIKELGDAPISFLVTHFGFWGHILKSMGQGIDNSPVSYYWKYGDPKSMGHSYTLPKDISDMEIIKAFILMLCQKVATRLRNGKKATYTVALTIRYRDFSTFCYRKSAGYQIDTPHGLYDICLKILDDIGVLKKSVRLLGVTATNLVDKPEQPYLIEDFERVERLNRAIVGINNRFGEFTIKPASLLMLNGLYTTVP